MCSLDKHKIKREKEKGMPKILFEKNKAGIPTKARKVASLILHFFCNGKKRWRTQLHYILSFFYTKIVQHVLKHLKLKKLQSECKFKICLPLEDLNALIFFSNSIISLWVDSTRANSRSPLSGKADRFMDFMLPC